VPQTKQVPPLREAAVWLYGEPPTPRELTAEESNKLRSQLEESLRQWDRGFSSKESADRLRTLREMSPSKSDIETLFPNLAPQLVPLFAQIEKNLAERIDSFAAQVIEGGEIKSIQVKDARRDLLKAEKFEELFRMIPGDVEVFEVFIRRVEASGGGATFLHLNGRWIWIKEVYAMPKIFRSEGLIK